MIDICLPLESCRWLVKIERGGGGGQLQIARFVGTLNANAGFINHSILTKLRSS